MKDLASLVGTFRSASNLSLLYASRRLTCVVALGIDFEGGAIFWASVRVVR